MKRAKCLLVTSFSDASLQLKDALKIIFSELGIEVMHPVDINLGKPLLDGISELLEQADFLVADISELNPNVLFEIGLALGMGLPISILSDHRTDIPAALEHKRVNLVRYDKDKGLNRDQALNVISILEKTGKWRYQLDKEKIILPPRDKAIISNPFNYLSTETIWPPQLLEKLFLVPPYFELACCPATAVLFGHRGCGKTMLLYMLRFRQNAATNIAGFYTKFQRLFMTSRGVESAFDVRKMTMFFNLAVLRAFANEVDIVRRQGKILEKEENEVLVSLEEKFGIHFKSFSNLATALSHFEEQELINYSFGLDLKEESTQPMNTIEGLHKPFFLEELAESLSDTSVFSNHSIAYLIDDYSSDWFPKNICHAFNKIIFKRSPWCSFKIATSLGHQLVWPLGESTYAEPHLDFLPINMTDIHFSSLDSEKIFLQGIINKRLKLAGIHQTTKGLFGSRPSDKPHIVDYSGIEGFTRLFSGDYATLLLACFKMTQKRIFTEPVSREIQNNILRSISTDIISRLELGYKWGNYVYNFVLYMMEFVMKKYLSSIEVRRVKRKKRRIFSGFIFEDIIKLSSEAKEKIAWLVRSGVIFPYSRSRRKQRYAVRKMLFPAFGIPIIGIKDYLVLDQYNSEIMLNNPERFWISNTKNISDEFQTSINHLE